MHSASTKPIYNLKVVVRETGLKPDTLRAWERRYHLPKPQRTDGGHRLYSQHDIEILKWLMERQSEGMSISRAVALWEELEKQQDPTQIVGELEDSTENNIENNIIENKRHNIIADPKLSPTSGKEYDILFDLQQRWVSACLDFNEQIAEQTLTQAFSIFPIEIICTKMLQQAMKTIGEGWYQGEVTIQQEHFASTLIIRRLESLLAAVPNPTRAGRILIGCPPHEEHTIGPLTLALLLKRKGWNVLYMGANIPLQNLLDTVRSVQPDLIILAAQQLHTASSLLDMVRLLLQENVDIAFSGLIFHQISILQREIPGQFLGHDFDVAIEIIQQHFQQERQPSIHKVTTLGEDIKKNTQQAMVHYRTRQHRIEAEVWENILHIHHDLNISQKNLVDANLNMGRDIIAALNLGDINYLTLDLACLQNFFVNHYQTTEDAIQTYLQAYLKACQSHLDTSGQIVIEWLMRQLNQES